MVHVAIINGELAIRQRLSHALRQLNHQVEIADSGSTGMSLVLASQPDIVILNMDLPDLDGMSVLKMLRAASDLPIIISGMRNDEARAAQALKVGADDYVVLPISAVLLGARIVAILRRTHGVQEAEELRIGGLRINVLSHEAALDGRVLDLRPKEFRLLAYLAVHAGRVVSKEELLSEIWGRVYGVTEKTVDVHLSWLRRRLGETAAEPRYLQSIRGVGVKLIDPKV